MAKILSNSDISVEIIKHPTEEDWTHCKLMALSTMGIFEVKKPPTSKWKHEILMSQHSPIRTLWFTIRVSNVKEWVSVHFLRHDHGCEPFISSQRSDRQPKGITYNRDELPQGEPLTMTLYINAPELIYMSGMRLCARASKETREVMSAIVNAVVEVNPEFKPFLVPKCLMNGGCNEFLSCGISDKKNTKIIY